MTGRTGSLESKQHTIGLLALLFALLFLFIRYRVDTGLLYLKGPGLFVFDLEFFRRYLDLPGRPARYLQLFLQELYWIPTLGALVVSGLIVLASLCIRSLFVRLAADRDRFAFTAGAWTATLLPALLMLVSYNRYEPVDLVSVLVTLLLALVYTTAFPRRALGRAAVFAGLLLVLAFLNLDMCPILASLCALWEIAGKRRCVTGLLYAVSGVLPYFTLSAGVFNLNTMSELALAVPLLFPKPVVPTIVVLGLISGLLLLVAALRRSRVVLFAGLLVLLFGAQWRFLASVPQLFCFAVVLVPTAAWVVADIPAVRAWKPGRVAGWSALAGVSAAFLAVALLSLDRQQQLYLKMTRSSRDRDWSEVLDIAARLSPDTFIEHPPAYSIVHRALYHQGRLPYSMLDYPTNLLRMMPPPVQARSPALRVDSGETAELCLDLGLVNHAELMACDLVDDVDPPAYAYELLVVVYIAKGNPAAARPLLNLLKKTIAHRAWAEHYTALIEHTSTGRGDGRIEQARANMIRRDIPGDARELSALLHTGWNWEVVLRRLLQANGSNRMAFEYLMSHYLLFGRPEKIIENMPRMWELGYGEMPTLYQEAVLMTCLMSDRRLDESKRRYLGPSLIEKYRHLEEIYVASGRDAAAALESAGREYSHTYFSYCMRLMRDAQDRSRNR